MKRAALAVTLVCALLCACAAPVVIPLPAAATPAPVAATPAPGETADAPDDIDAEYADITDGLSPDMTGSRVVAVVPDVQFTNIEVKDARYICEFTDGVC